MKTMAVKADLTNKENITNHPARKTMIQKLNDNQVPPTHNANFRPQKHAEY